MNDDECANVFGRFQAAKQIWMCLKIEFENEILIIESN